MNEENKPVRWEILFSGGVQGVGFRYTSAVFAQQLGLTGSVRNLADGRVRMEVQGSRDRITELLIRLKSTPPIDIEDFSVKELPLNEGESRFSILR